ncbi:hypothetical protein [Gracilimonas sediminicola]|uniref:hypothetical protein n=1 Tax=Gracilimonas sediminicola TaxID=2952158 RepID=UPI0038D463AC
MQQLQHYQSPIKLFNGGVLKMPQYVLNQLYTMEALPPTLFLNFKTKSKSLSMKTKILCWIGIIWGGAIVIRGIASISTLSDSATDAGRFTALFFGIILLGVSIYNLRKEYKKKDK